MTENTVRKYDYEDVQALPTRPVPVIPLHPTGWQLRTPWMKTTPTPERVVDLVLVVRQYSYGGSSSMSCILAYKIIRSFDDHISEERDGTGKRRD